MFDVDFFRNTHDLGKRIAAQESTVDKAEIYETFEKFRSRRPYVFNVETTNLCNMTCHMCPRPTLMTRHVEHMDMDLFEKVINQITPHSDSSLNEFFRFVESEYSIRPEERNENAFYFYNVSRCVILHGYGEPPLDPLLIDRIKLCTERRIPTYFSCVPANINIHKFIEMMKAGAGVIKFAIDALDDEKSKNIRGQVNNFTKSYEKICELLEERSRYPSIKTQIVITMIELSPSPEDIKMHKDFMDLWRDKPVLAYIKSQDNRWLYEEEPTMECKSQYETRYCDYPWTSTSVMVDGSVVPCTQDYNNEIVFGNARVQPLVEIWNSKGYENFRKWHIFGNFPNDHKCYARCDQKLVCDRLWKKAPINETALSG